MAGTLIIITGLHGSGKSTQTRLIAKWVNEKYQNRVVQLKSFIDKYDDKKCIRQSVEYINQHKMKKVSKSEMGFLQAAFQVRKNLLEVAHLLKNGQVVVLDRYVESLFAPLSLYVEVDPRHIYRIVESHIIHPDIYCYLQVPPQIAYRRLINRGEPLKNNESLEKLEQLYLFHQNHPLPQNLIWDRVDGTLSSEKVFKEICDLIERKLF